MATEPRTGNSNAFLYFAIGALIVAVGVLGWMFYDGQWRAESSSSAVERSADAISDAAEDVSDSVRDARTAPPPQQAPAPAIPPAEPGPS
jgi:hypothetical protein